MADKKEGKKKGGKLPIILVAVLVVAGGGFFAMNGSKKSEEPEEEPEVKLGAVVKLGDEIIVNLKDGKTFLVTQISVQTEEGAHVTDPAGGDGKEGDHGGGDKGGSYSVARDAINQVLSHKSIEDITKPGAMKYLKRELAAAMNHNLHASHPPEKGDKKKKKKKKEDEEHGHAEIDHEWLDEIGMDAEEGPILKVFFDKFMFTK
ncbi:MAG: flagellar basal body-associated FliL family protein [Armatimonadetes bacterium]|nr:flagellar basal body-associated FliL family protein [Armatimonadota bacterium]